jgi:hypothetical protein
MLLGKAGRRQCGRRRGGRHSGRHLALADVDAFDAPRARNHDDRDERDAPAGAEQYRVLACLQV